MKERRRGPSVYVRFVAKSTTVCINDCWNKTNVYLHSRCAGLSTIGGKKTTNSTRTEFRFWRFSFEWMRSSMTVLSFFVWQFHLAMKRSINCEDTRTLDRITWPDTRPQKSKPKKETKAGQERVSGSMWAVELSSVSLLTSHQMASAPLDITFTTHSIEMSDSNRTEFVERIDRSVALRTQSIETFRPD